MIGLLAFDRQKRKKKKNKKGRINTASKQTIILVTGRSLGYGATDDLAADRVAGMHVDQ